MHILDSLLAFSAYFFIGGDGGTIIFCFIYQNYTAQRMAINQKQ